MTQPPPNQMRRRTVQRLRVRVPAHPVTALAWVYHPPACATWARFQLSPVAIGRHPNQISVVAGTLAWLVPAQVDAAPIIHCFPVKWTSQVSKPIGYFLHSLAFLKPKKNFVAFQVLFFWVEFWHVALKPVLAPVVDFCFCLSVVWFYPQQASY